MSPFFDRPYTTKQNETYWSKREGGWKEYLETWRHPHRYFISHILKQINWFSLVELGCGSGANLRNIVEVLPNRNLGGIDINPKAIELAEKTFKGGFFRVGSAEDVFMSDKSTDLVLTDMLLIYVAPFKIKKYLREIKRIARNHVVLCEFHHKSWWQRLKLRVFSGRHAYDYEKLLTKLGFWDVQAIKIPQFEEDNEQEFRYLIVARVPKR